jgi:ATP-dependent Lhr-like helicase
MMADDLMAAVFPDAAACLENIPGDREIPDHPLVKQTVEDCLQEAMDHAGLCRVLEKIHGGELRLLARDTPEPSVFSHEILNARPYAFLDDAPLEERRAHAVQTRRAGEPSSARDLGALDPAAIDRVRDEARPQPRDADELHDALLSAGFLREAEIGEPALFESLAARRRAARVDAWNGAWVAAERVPEVLAVCPAAALEPAIEPPASRDRAWTPDDALAELVRSRLTILGPVTSADLAASFGVGESAMDAALGALESEGVVLRGRFTPASSEAGRRDALEWCDRALLSRIHRYTLNRLRAEIEPVSAADFMRFLFKWQHVSEPDRLTGIDGLREIVTMLEGFELPAAAWERAVLPARLTSYEPQMLDLLCLAGEVSWARLTRAAADGVNHPRLVPATPVALFLREHGDVWYALGRSVGSAAPVLTDEARRVLEQLHERGASFLKELAAATGLDQDGLRRAIGTLVACGLAVSDGFSGLRALIRPSSRAYDRRATFAGRWTATQAACPERIEDSGRGVEMQAWTLLRRYGVICRKLLAREANAAPWRELTRIYRRLEARGEIRGGRFVSGMSGEQFALPQAVETLRELRRTQPGETIVTISAADPLNLTGIVTPGDRIRVAGRNRIGYRHGVPVAVREGDFVRDLAPLDGEIAITVHRTLAYRYPRRAVTANS